LALTHHEFRGQSHRRLQTHAYRGDIRAAPRGSFLAYSTIRTHEPISATTGRRQRLIELIIPQRLRPMAASSLAFSLFASAKDFRLAAYKDLLISLLPHSPDLGMGSAE
jgi:hypothetical protein